MKRGYTPGTSAFSLVELIVAAAVGSIVMAAMLSGAMMIQRCLAGAEDFALAKGDQARLSDYLALDLRRALTVTAGPAGGSTIMTATIPAYYDNTGQPRTPTITNYVANYGDAAQPVTVVYRKIGSSIVRQENAGALQIIAENVADFQLSVEDLGKVVKTQITFAPRFRHVATAGTREATSVFTTTLLRNKRKDI